MMRLTQRRALSSFSPSVSPREARVLPGTCALAGAILLWLAFPPVGWCPCAWIAPVPWLLVARAPGPLPRFAYGKFFFGGVLFWLAMLQGIRLAHPANYLGLAALSLYLAVYLPAFVAVVRYVAGLPRVPPWLAAPVVWTAWELVRGYLFTGFSVGLLGHTQAPFPWLLQISDLTGAYGVSFLVMLVASCLTELVLGSRDTRRWLPAAIAIGSLAGCGAYGSWRLAQDLGESTPPLRVALLQGTRDKVFETNPRLERESFQQYVELMKQARDADPNLDLIIWPEAAFTELVPEILVEGTLEPPAGSGWTAEEARQRAAATRQAFSEKVRDCATIANRIWRDGQFQEGQVHLLVGLTSFAFRGQETRHYNSAVAIDPAGNITFRYHKMHRVMFGEYVPFARIWPWLARLTPIGAGLDRGLAPVLMDVKGYQLSPSICFESTVPHLIRKQVRQLAQQTTRSPDLLVNLSDDGWFFGSSILDLHLACGVFRAVEMRCPFLVASNTGISAVIDGAGRVVQRLPHHREGRFLVAAVSRDQRFSGYRQWGDAFAAACLAASLWWVLRARLVRRRSPAATQEPVPSPA